MAMYKKAVIVCQTPFQFYNAVVISKLISIPIELWLIDSHMEVFAAVAESESIWENVYIASRETKGNKLKFFSSIVSEQKRIKKYLKVTEPSHIYVFADNNELCAAFVNYGKKICNSSIILVEEGATVYSSPFRVKAGFHKFLFRKLLGINNPRGYLIGWSKNIDKLVVSNKELVHPGYRQDRTVLEWPKSKFPGFAADIFLKNIDVEKKITKGGVLYLGQPIVEMGVIPADMEIELLTLLNDIEAEKVFVKYHPFEKEDKHQAHSRLHFFPDELKFIPVEVLFDIIAPKLVVSYFSGAGINFSIRNQKNAVFYLPEALPDSYKDFIINNFSNIKKIHIVKELNTLEKVITSVVTKTEENKEEKDEDLEEWRKMINQTITL